MNIAWWVQRWGELHPEKTAVIYKNKAISYRELHRRADRTSCWFQSLGIEKGDRVAAMITNCPEFLEIFIACSRLGAIFIPVNYRLAAPELRFTLMTSRPRLFVFGQRDMETAASLGLSISLPLFHSGGLFIQAAPILYKGATLVIHPHFEPAHTLQDISRYGITKFLGVPTVYRALLRVPSHERGDLSSLKVCAIGGEKTTVELLKACGRAGFPLRQIMGQTETSILLWASEEDSLRKPGTVGRPVFHADVEIMDREGRRVFPGQVGKIVVRGSIMMKEYWQDPVRTEETIKNGWLHTGDLARMDEEGYFYLVDRARDMYITGGENVYPAEVEKVLMEHRGIEEVAVAGIPDPVWGESGVAFVILRKETQRLDPSEILTVCDGKLAAYKRPKKWYFVRSSPGPPWARLKSGFSLKCTGLRRVNPSINRLAVPRLSGSGVSPLICLFH
ncbi:MAG: AMP-binding protein [Deltaproteobacteria bacterium]|nr:AMP-binding protein [Deltaproteobacteria bacterium]